MFKEEDVSECVCVFDSNPSGWGRRLVAWRRAYVKVNGRWSVGISWTAGQLIDSQGFFVQITLAFACIIYTKIHCY
jgi:hypothetical protein